MNEAETEANSHEADIRGQICVNFLAKFYILIPFSQKKRNFRSIFHRTSKIVAQNWLYHGDIISKDR